MLPIIIPIIVVISMAVKLDSSGSVFYLGVRTGRYGKPFKIYKFRTMVPDAEKIGGGTTALNDPRVTGLGAFLRKYKLDELPQFFNVLNGSMSFVGPRPELSAYTDNYKDFEKCILDVRPGITDLSSLEFSSLGECVGSDDSDRIFEEKILPIKNQLRVKYVQTQSFFLDIKIIIKTVFKIIKQKI